MMVLSPYQFTMLQTLYDHGIKSYMSIDDAQHFDQRPFRSMLVRGYCAYKPGRGFHLTDQGKKAMEIFMTTNISRTDPSRPLTAYFDPTAYGLPSVSKKNGKAAPTHRHAA